MADTNREFERYMSDLGEATNPAGDGLYSSPRVRRRFDDFRAGFEAARALASRPAEVDDEVAGFEKTLRKSQVTMDPEIASVLGNNLWDLYESDQEELPTLPQGVAVM